MNPEQRIKALAWSAAKKYARDDIEEMAKDLEMAGWIGYLSRNAEEELKLMSARRYITDAWVAWRFGVRCRARVQIVKRGEPANIEDVGTYPDNSQTPEELAAFREMIEQLTRDMDESRFSVLRAMVLDGSPRLVEPGLPLSYKAIFKHKGKIREKLDELI